MEWTKYTTKEALKDNDELMILDTDGKANKRTLMDKIWDYVVDKMTTAVIAKLGTTNKTLIGAVNELNSKVADTRVAGNQTVTLAVNDYRHTSLLIAINKTMYWFNNGYLSPINVDASVTASISKDYNTITLKNNTSNSYKIGIICYGKTQYKITLT